MNPRPGVKLIIDEGAAGRADLLALTQRLDSSSEIGLELRLFRSGVVRAQVVPVPLAEARLRLATWSKDTINALLGPARAPGGWRDALNNAFFAEATETVMIANDTRMPLSVVAMQVERPYDKTFVRASAVWDVVEPWLSERFPSLTLLQFNRRITALVPGLSVKELPVVAEELRRTLEAARQARVIDTTVAIGIASLPEDAHELLPLLRLAEGAALRSSAQQATMVVRAVPTLLLVGDELPKQLGSSPLLTRLDIRVLNTTEAEALALMKTEHPTAVVVNLGASAAFLNSIAQVIELIPHSRIIFVSHREEDAQLAERWRGFPQATVLEGKRLAGRVLEEIAISLGLKPRRHLRRDGELPVEIDVGGTLLKGSLLNISESGARVRVSAPRIDPQLTMRMKLPEGEVLVSARAVWQRQQGHQCEAGLKFEVVADQDRPVIAHFVDTPEVVDPPRAFPRIVVRQQLQLKLRVRPRDSRVTHYLTLVDLSEGGCLASGLPLEVLQPKALFDLHFFGDAGTFGCVGELARRRDVESERSEYGWRFVEIDRRDQSTLKKLLLSVVPPPTSWKTERAR